MAVPSLRRLPKSDLCFCGEKAKKQVHVRALFTKPAGSVILDNKVFYGKETLV